MRLVLLQDFKITDEESNELQRQFIDLYYEHTNITPQFYVEKTNYISYPTYVDEDGDKRPTQGYLKDTTDSIYARYGEFGTDHVILLIHEDNWLSDTDTTKGIWGTNWSNVYHSYQVQYCRFDRDNMANSIGTLYHEIHHSHDTLIKSTLGIDINPILRVTHYDNEITHGQGKGWSYIRHKENTKSLATMAPYLMNAYEKRRDLHMEHVGLMKTAINLLQKIIVLHRSKQNRKDGVPRM